MKGWILILKSYFKYVIPTLVNNSVRIEISDVQYKRIEEFAEEVIKVKEKENHYIKDRFNMKKRFMTGIIGESAVEQLLGIPIVDFTIGDSKSYNHPDIPYYNVGIKTVEYFKFPVVPIRNEVNQMICIKGIESDKEIYVCGLATVEVLNEYQDIDLILSDNLRARNIKTGFYGFNKLIKVESLADIKDYKS